ncbi:hypothetical protein GCM10022243_20050 [Saccharothrix violaceirubra]|uniref:Polysaccharide deacetylase n=1 Tax=Saccharothrix violaceirubra TaxID=413306 RepID=A0A7W7T218_9PSEU|nr:hypothetical protein [Saccharothrix violaceirubra]MBB4965091.1 hypothetical protein [Saccharothrix violaceirubra]
MRMSEFGRRGRMPVLVVVALALAAFTVASPSGPAGTDVVEPGSGAAAAPFPVARKHQVPVRPARPPAGGAVLGDRVALRQLVLATGPDDFGLTAWKSVLDVIGTPYDVLYAGTEPVTPDRLVRADGTGRYSAVLLSNGALLHDDGTGVYNSALDGAQWEALWDYERRYRVRQVALNTAPGSTPEDYCLRQRDELDVGPMAVPLTITGPGVDLFDDLRTEPGVPLTHSYLYRADLAPDCAAEPILSTPDGVVAVRSRAPDGRERVALTFSTGAETASTTMIGYGLVRWANRGVFLGERRHWFVVDVDDWFNATLRRRADGTAGQYRMTGRDVLAAVEAQRRLRADHPVAAQFTLNLPFNGSKLKPSAEATCDDDAPDTLSSCSKAMVNEFRWINHTATHPQMNRTAYDVNRTEISRNLDFAAAAGLPVPSCVLKTPEYSGLGVYNPTPNSLDPPTDFGLTGSNQDLLDAARDVGIKYLQGNMSFASHRPTCANCGTYHPLRPELLVVPDWPVSVAFEATEPDEQVSQYNAEYGRNGTAADHADHDVTYDEFVEEEARVASGHLLGGSVYAHTLHQGNFREYAPGHSLGFDWITATVAKYAKYYRVPLKSPDWLSLAGYVRDRTAHFAELASGHDAVWDRSTGAITYSPGSGGSLFLTGVELRDADDADQVSGDDGETYGTDTVAKLGLTGSEPAVVMARPRP